jgi:galactokinase
VWVVANSLVASDKAVSAATHYNKRVLECRLAAMLTARHTGLVKDWRAVRTLRQLAEALSPGRAWGEERSGPFIEEERRKSMLVGVVGLGVGRGGPDGSALQGEVR